MMIKCTGEITPEQVQTLQEYKTEALTFDYKQENYKDLLYIDWEALKYVPENPDEEIEGQGTGPVDMSEEELIMSNEVEELADEMKREANEDIKANMGKTSIAFMDINNMSTSQNIIFLSVVFGLAYAAFKFVYAELVENKDDFNKERKEKIATRKKRN